MTLRRLLPRALPLAPLLLATAAQAHPGHPHPYDDVDEFDIPGVVEAVMHPFTGLDHLVAALAVGCLAFVMGRRLGGMLATLFVGALTLGWAAGRMGMALPMLEQGLALSVIAVGVVLAMGSKAGSVLRFGVIAVMGLWHGGAHGMEMQGTVSGLGLILGTGLVMGLGSLTVSGLVKVTPAMSRYAGAAAAVIGLVMIIQRHG